MRLRELQRQMFAEITGTAANTTAAYIKPNDRLPALQRLGIYSMQYGQRLHDSLGDDFPGLAGMLGHRRFQKLAYAYFAHFPSRSFTLRDLGRYLPDWLAYSSEYTLIRHDMARLEWAHVETYDSADSQPLSTEDLGSFTPNQPVALQPHIRLLQVSFAVDDLRLNVRSERAVKARGPRPIYLATHRANGDVFYRRLEPGEFAILKKLAPGTSLAKALRGITATPEDLQRWFATWAQLGWLCHPPAKRTSARSRGR